MHNVGLHLTICDLNCSMKFERPIQRSRVWYKSKSWCRFWPPFAQYPSIKSKFGVGVGQSLGPGTRPDQGADTSPDQMSRTKGSKGVAKVRARNRYTNKSNKGYRSLVQTEVCLELWPSWSDSLQSASAYVTMCWSTKVSCFKRSLRIHQIQLWFFKLSHFLMFRI